MDISWKAIPVPELAEQYEVSPTGAVRDVFGVRMMPQMISGVAAYELPHRDGESVVPVKGLLASFGIKETVGAQWVAEATTEAGRANSLRQRKIMVKELIERVHNENDEMALEKLVSAVAQGCPWSLGRLEGKEADADPVLGF